MIKEVSVLNAFSDYREARNYADTVLEDAVLITLHGKNGDKLHGVASKINIQEMVMLFGENNE